MVATDGVVTRGKLYAAAVTQLFGMQFNGQAQAVCSLENPFGLRHAKANPFAKCINRIHQPFSMQQRQHAHHFIDIVIGAASKLRRHGMRAQERGLYRYWIGHAQTTRHAQRFALVLQRQAVTRFDFNRGHAFSQQSQKARFALRLQLSLSRCACGLDGRRNTAARVGNVFVACTVQALLKLCCPVTAVDQMRVAIDKARCDERAPGVMDAGAICHQVCGQVIAWAYPLQQAAVDDQRCVVNQSVGLLATCLKGGCLAIEPDGVR